MDSSQCNDRIEPMQRLSALGSSEPPAPDRSDKTDEPGPDPARAGTPWGSVRGDRAPKNEHPGRAGACRGYSLVLGTAKTGSEGLGVLQTWAADLSPEVIFLGASSPRFALLRHAPSLCA